MSTTLLHHPASGLQGAAHKPVKCVVWDLDDTLWTGTLLEDPEVVLRPGTVATLQTLDQRGILNSIASKNDPDLAMARLKAVGIDEYFLHPQLGWGAKSNAIRLIAEKLNIGLNTLMFVDDQPFERDEVNFHFPEVRTLEPDEIERLIDHPDLSPAFITADARMRRALYQADIRRAAEEAVFSGPSNEFLASLQLVLRIHRACQEDLRRAEELTIRTNQLNTTGITYSYDELGRLCRSSDHFVLMADLEDRYGAYGKIGLAVIERTSVRWTIKLLLVSCRVMSRGVGRILIREIISRSRQAHVELRAEFLATPRNRQMFVAYRFAGFSEIAASGSGPLQLRHDGTDPGPVPSYITVGAEW